MLSIYDRYCIFLFYSISLFLQVPNEFIITMKKGKKIDSMRFSSDHRPDIITEALIFRHKFTDPLIDNLVSKFVLKLLIFSFM